MNRISEACIQDINDKADVLAVVGEYIRLEKKGGRYWGLCPFHNEKTPSFSVDPDKKFYYCFGCHKGGGLVNFLMELEKMTYPEALEALAKKNGVELVFEGESHGEHAKVREQENRLEMLSELYRRVAGSFHHILMETDMGLKARNYLESRAISEEMITRFNLGYAPMDRSWLYAFLKKKGYSPEFLSGSGLFSQKHPRSSFFSDRLIFPILDRRSRNVAFGGRILSGEGPKYLNSSESELYKKRETLFAIDIALPEIRRTKEAYLCEGYMDVIALHQAGIGTAVAPLGTAFTDEQARLLCRWAEKVYIFFDSDSAGRSATVKAILTSRNAGLACAIISTYNQENYKDPADILKELGPEALQKGAKCFINDFDYLIAYGKILASSSDSEGVAKAVAFLFPFVETLDSEVSRDMCIGSIADAFGVDRASVRLDYAQRNRGPGNNHQPIVPTPLMPLRMNDDLFLLIAVVVNRSLFPKLRSALSVEEVDDPYAKELFITLEECFRDDSHDTDNFLARIGDEALKGFVIQKSASDAFLLQPEKLVEDGITRVKQKRLERRRDEIVLRLRTARNGSQDADRELDNLLTEKVHIDAELRRLKDDYE